jgi:hypothetical protein
MHTRRRSYTNRSAGLLACAAALGALSFAVPGCNIVAPIAYAIHGPGNVEPVATLDPEKTVVYFIDDPSSKLAQRRLRYTMADVASRKLLEKEVVTDVLDSRTILNAASKERQGDRMSISELGKAVGAETVIYAVVTNFSLSAEQGTFVPVASLRVKIIEVADGRRTWPDSEAGYLLEVRLAQRPSASGEDRGRLAIETQLAEQTGLALAQLFYKHEITESALRGR